MDIVERLRNEPELTPAQYWEAQADMWHQNYKEATNEIKRLRSIVTAYGHEIERLREALQTIAEEDSGWGQYVAFTTLKERK